MGFDLQCCAFCHMECLFYEAACQGGVVPFYTCALAPPSILTTVDIRSGVEFYMPLKRTVALEKPLGELADPGSCIACIGSGLGSPLLAAGVGFREFRV